MDRPASPTDDNTPEYKAVLEKWERLNRMGLMIVKDTIPKLFRGGEEDNDLKQFLAEMDWRFARSDNPEKNMLLHHFSTMRYHGNGKIKDQLKSSYNTQKKQWSLNKLIEERMKEKRIESAHTVYTSKGHGKRKKFDHAKDDAAKGPTQKKHDKVEDTCFFCRKGVHINKNCPKYHAWRAKNTWWLDSGATTNISVSLQGCLSYRTPTDAERHIHVANGSPDESLSVELRGTKRKFEDANSGTLWHQCLCHISRNRVERLVLEVCDATMIEPDDYETEDKSGWLNAKLEDEPEAGLEHAGLISHSSDNEEHVKQI
ncbi:hypothetical protein BRARA_F01915 [Brassica rapa]|uniref:Uncharacterized protein n=1 Tax=Brassica campestris TaxID=3711 RepID=A0A397Z616_BRACM|nr:hypothetical protein BRARA_F01915 [Brassica rapa]